MEVLRPGPEWVLQLPAHATVTGTRDPSWICDLCSLQQHRILNPLNKAGIKSTSSQTLQCFLFVFVLLGPHPRHMEVPSLGVELELQLLAYTTATATPDPQPTEEGQGSNRILMDTSRVHNLLSHNGLSFNHTFKTRHPFKNTSEVGKGLEQSPNPGLVGVWGSGQAHMCFWKPTSHP